MLLDKYKGYEALRGDTLVISLFTYNAENYKLPENGVIYLDELKLNSKQKVCLIKSYFYCLKIDLMKTNKKIIVDTHDLDVFDVLKNFDSNCDIYCLGMPNETTESLFEKIRNNDKSGDWSKYISNDTLKIQCEDIIKESKKLFKQCQELDIPFFDTSGDREEKIMKAMKVIEEKSIE